MKSALLGLVILSISFAFSSEVNASISPSQSTEQFCADRSDGSFVKNLSRISTNLMSFKNHGGIGNGGVCWWHSRFQRSALYLTVYKPAEPMPDTEEAKKIIKKIRAANEIVTIPGFQNFYQFSGAYYALIQDELERWQKTDGITKFNWVMGLSGVSESSPKKMKKKMDELFQYVVLEGNIAYQKLQIKGLMAHAWLVVDMKKVDDGYDLEIIDSNFQWSTSFYKYRNGQTAFDYHAYGKANPYLEREREMEGIHLAVLKVCDPEEYERKKPVVPNNNNEF